MEEKKLEEYNQEELQAILLKGKYSLDIDLMRKIHDQIQNKFRLDNLIKELERFGLLTEIKIIFNDKEHWPNAEWGFGSHYERGFNIDIFPKKKIPEFLHDFYDCCSKFGGHYIWNGKYANDLSSFEADGEIKPTNLKQRFESANSEIKNRLTNKPFFNNFQKKLINYLRKEEKSKKDNKELIKLYKSLVNFEAEKQLGNDLEYSPLRLNLHWNPNFEWSSNLGIRFGTKRYDFLK